MSWALLLGLIFPLLTCLRSIEKAGQTLACLLGSVVSRAKRSTSHDALLHLPTRRVLCVCIQLIISMERDIRALFRYLKKTPTRPLLPGMFLLWWLLNLRTSISPLQRNGSAQARSNLAPENAGNRAECLIQRNTVPHPWRAYSVLFIRQPKEAFDVLLYAVLPAARTDTSVLACLQTALTTDYSSFSLHSAELLKTNDSYMGCLGVSGMLESMFALLQAGMITAEALSFQERHAQAPMVVCCWFERDVFLCFVEGAFWIASS